MTFQKTVLVSLTLLTTLAAFSGAKAMHRRTQGDKDPATGGSSSRASTHAARPSTSESAARPSRFRASERQSLSGIDGAIEAFSRATFKEDAKAGALDRYALRQSYAILRRIHEKTPLTSTLPTREAVNALKLKENRVFDYTQAAIHDVLCRLSEDQATQFAKKFAAAWNTKADDLAPGPVAAAAAFSSESPATPSRAQEDKRFEEFYGQFLTAREKHTILPFFEEWSRAADDLNQGSDFSTPRRAHVASLLARVEMQFFDFLATKTPEVVVSWVQKLKMSSYIDLEYLPQAFRLREILVAKKKGTQGKIRAALTEYIQKVDEGISNAGIIPPMPNYPPPAL